MRISFCTAIAITVICLGAAPAPAQTPQDEKQLGGLLDQWIAARNANDAAQMRSIFDEHMDQMRMPTGEVIASTADGTVQWFDDGFKRDRGTTVRILKRNVRVLSPDAAVIDFTFTLHRADQSVAANTMVTFFCVRRPAGWKVGALRFASVPVDRAK